MTLPLNVVFAYVLELQCSECELQDSWRGRSKRTVEKFARSAGWRFKGDEAKCPIHAKEQKAERAVEHSPSYPVSVRI